MKIQISKPLIGYNGQPIRTGSDPNAPEATLRSTLELALVNAQGPEYQTGEKKYELYQLLQKIHGADSEVELTAEQVATLKKLAGQAFGVGVVGAIYDALEGKVEG